MWSDATLVTSPVAAPIALAEVKEFVRVDAGTADFDTQLTSFAAVGVAQIEAMCSIRLAPQVIELRADEWADLAHLPVGPVTGIVSVHYLDRDGAEQLLNSGFYELAGAGLARSIRPSWGSRWPVPRYVLGTIRVQLNVGYASLPRPLWAAALYLTGDLFAFRETAVTGTIAAKIPVSANVEAMLANYRIWL